MVVCSSAIIGCSFIAALEFGAVRTLVYAAPALAVAALLAGLWSILRYRGLRATYLEDRDTYLLSADRGTRRLIPVDDIECAEYTLVSWRSADGREVSREPRLIVRRHGAEPGLMLDTALWSVAELDRLFGDLGVDVRTALEPTPAEEVTTFVEVGDASSWQRRHPRLAFVVAILTFLVPLVITAALVMH